MASPRASLQHQYCCTEHATVRYVGLPQSENQATVARNLRNCFRKIDRTEAFRWKCQEHCKPMDSHDSPAQAKQTSMTAQSTHVSASYQQRKRYTAGEANAGAAANTVAVEAVGMAIWQWQRRWEHPCRQEKRFPSRTGRRTQGGESLYFQGLV